MPDEGFSSRGCVEILGLVVTLLKSSLRLSRAQNPLEKTKHYNYRPEDFHTASSYERRDAGNYDWTLVLDFWFCFRLFAAICDANQHPRPTGLKLATDKRQFSQHFARVQRKCVLPAYGACLGIHPVECFPPEEIHTCPLKHGCDRDLLRRGDAPLVESLDVVVSAQ